MFDVATYIRGNMPVIGRYTELASGEYKDYHTDACSVGWREDSSREECG